MTALDPRLRYRPIELATGAVFGDGEPEGLPDHRPTIISPRVALEQTIEDALRRGPCMVSFSGGRDSSTVLAVATHVARRADLPLPVPVTIRKSGDVNSDESNWQELVVQHLGLERWHVLEAGTRFDIVGPLATQVHARLGLLPPMNLHLHEPVAELASGGVVLTGAGGDELLSGRSRSIWARARYDRTIPRPSEFRALLAEAAPRPVRTRRAVRGPALADMVWLTGRARDEFRRDYGRMVASYPLAWDASVQLWWTRRVRHLLTGAFSALGSHHGASIEHPLASPAFAVALCGRYGREGPASRARALNELVGDLLPRELIIRSTKATFNGVLFTELAREAASSWDGEGVDTGLVDAGQLRRQWLGPDPAANSFALLQSVTFR